MTSAVFWLFAVAAVGGTVLCITRRNPVASALWLVWTLFSLAVLFLVLQAQFIAVIQVLVYAGAIMVLFLFVIMLLNLGRQARTDMIGWAGRVMMGAVGALLLAQLWAAARIAAAAQPAGAFAATDAAAPGGVVGAISEPLFRDYLVPFELTSILLLAAIVGAVVLAKRRL